MIQAKIKGCWSEKSTSKQICVGVSLIMGITVILVSLALFIQFLNIKRQQQVLPKKFFATYDKLSLLGIAKANKDLILDVLDFRRNLINIIRRSLISNRMRIRQKPSRSRRKMIPINQTIQCIFSIPNQTIFSCKMDLQTDFLLKGLNIFQFNLPIKRYNIYYQNKANKDDVMLKSLSRNKITSINITGTNQKIVSLKQGNFIFTDFYKDYYENNTNVSMAYRAKITFENYSILLEQQGFGSFIQKSIAKNMYSQDVNAMVLLPDKSRISGYNVISRLKRLNPQLNYSELLQPGYHETVLANGEIISSYTEPFPSSFAIQSKINTNLTDGKGNHVLIIHSPCINKDMEYNIINLIENLSSALILLLVFGFVVLIYLTITFYITQIIKRSLQSIKTNISKYLNKVQLTGIIIKLMLQFRSSLELFNNISKSIYEIIKIIDHKKRTNYKKKSNSFQQNDYFPLNLNQNSFKRKHFLKHSDDIKANQIKELIENHNKV